MESVNQYYALLQKLNITDTLMEQSCDCVGDEQFSVDNTINLSGSVINKDYFDKINVITDLFVDLYRDHLAQKKVLDRLYQIIPLEQRTDYRDLKLLCLIDILRCYYGLNHPVELNTPEGISLLLLLSKFYRPSFYFNYETLLEVPDCIVDLDAILPYIDACSNEIGIIEGEPILLSKVLSSFNQCEDITYRKLIYRFCDAVARVDETMSKLETEWLQSILRLDDNDSSNDINIDMSVD